MPAIDSSIVLDYRASVGTLIGPAPTLARASVGYARDITGAYGSYPVDRLRYGWSASLGYPARRAVVEVARTNLLAAPFAPATQTVAVVIGTVYTLSVRGGGSATLSDAGAGVAVEGAPLVFTAATASATVTVSGTPSSFQLEAGGYATSHTSGTRARDTLWFALPPAFETPGPFGLYLRYRKIFNLYGDSLSNRIFQLGNGPAAFPAFWAAWDASGRQQGAHNNGVDPTKTGTALQVFAQGDEVELLMFINSDTSGGVYSRANGGPVTGNPIGATASGEFGAAWPSESKLYVAAADSTGSRAASMDVLDVRLRVGSPVEDLGLTGAEALDHMAVVRFV